MSNTALVMQHTTYQAIRVCANPVIHVVFAAIHSNRLYWCTQWHIIEYIVRNFLDNGHIEAHLSKCVEIWKRAPPAALHQEQCIAVTLDNFPFIIIRQYI